jgi:hypothetical protein
MTTRRATLLLAAAIFVMTDCKSTPPVQGDAGARATPDPAVSAGTADASLATAAMIDAGAHAALPPASDAIELVAVGKGWSSKIVWLVAVGSRVWLSGMGFDAYADEDGPFVPAPDMLKGLPYKLPAHRIQVVGSYPTLFVLRTNNVNGRLASEEATVFVRTGETWKEAPRLPHLDAPHAFVYWNGGALLIDSQIELNASATWEAARAGTTFTFVAADGTVSEPKIPLERAFLAWAADSDGTTLSLLGTRGMAPPKGEAMAGSSGVVVARGSGKEPMTLTALSPSVTAMLETYSSKVRERTAGAIVFPPPSPFAREEGAWLKTPALSIHAVTDGKAKTVRVGGGGDEQCGVTDATTLGSDVYAILHCLPEATRLVRVADGGKPQNVKLPALAKNEGGGFRVAHEKENAFACTPKKLVARGADDLFIESSCGGATNGAAIPAVFRRGRAQDPVVLP